MRLLLAVALTTISVVFGQLLEGTAVGPTTALSAKTRICNVLDYGGVADGTTDISPAITKAFACVTSASTGATLYIPEGNYLSMCSMSYWGSCTNGSSGDWSGVKRWVEMGLSA